MNRLQKIYQYLFVENMPTWVHESIKELVEGEKWDEVNYSFTNA